MSLLSSLRKSANKSAKAVMDSAAVSSSVSSSGSGVANYNYPRTINWYPGHMVKAQRMLESDFLPRAQIILEIRDSRIPISSINHHIEPLIGKKPRLIVFNKAGHRWRSIQRRHCQSIHKDDASRRLTVWISIIDIDDQIY